MKKLILLSLIFLLFVLSSSSSSKEMYTNRHVFLAIRSYNRPKYLKQTLDSLSTVNKRLVSKIWIYDDGSTDPDTIRILRTHPLISTNNVQVKMAQPNVGCEQSYLDLLTAMKPHREESECYCIVDNDVVFAKNAFDDLIAGYDACRRTFGETDPIVLSGFRPTNSHNHNYDNTTDYPLFQKTECVGAVCYLFDDLSFSTVYKGWENRFEPPEQRGYGSDWGVCRLIGKSPNMHFCVLKHGVVNHVGAEGLHSDADTYDTDELFNK